MVEMFMQIMSLLDPILLFWAVVLNVLGFYLKRVELPKYAPPIPLLLYLVAFVPCFVLGWLRVDGFSGKAALEATLYGISNAGLVTLPAVFGYDVVHAFTGKKTAKREYTIDCTSPCAAFTKVKWIVYGCSTFVATVTAFAVSFFVFKETIVYAFCWAVLFGGVAFVTSRIVLYAAKKVATAESIAIDVYLYIALASWLGLILTDSWLFVSLYGAVLVGAILMAVGTRYLDPVEEDVNELAAGGFEGEILSKPFKFKKEKHQEGESELDFLKRTLRFRFVDDNLDGLADPSKPVCPVDDDALTCDEADSRGFGAIAAEGIEYCKMLLRKKEEL